MKKKLSMLAAGALMVAALGMFGCSSGDPATQPADNSSANSTAPDNSAAANNDDAAVGGEIVLVNDGKLTIAASLDFPPFENLNTDGEAEGFEVDLMKAICDEMGLECNYLPSTKFDTIVPLISAGGKADVGVSGFTVTPERAKEIDFTDVIMDINQGVAVMKDSGITSVDQLEGKKIGAQSGTTGYEWALENVEGAEVLAFDEMTGVFAALQSGQVDAVAADLPVVQYYVLNAYQDAEVIAEVPTGEQYAIVVSKDNPALTKALNEAIAKLKADGTYDQLTQKWFGA